jgi:hypothetical protein
MALDYLRSIVDGLTGAAATSEGIDIRDVDPFTTLLVQTMNSWYRIIPLEAGRSRIVVQGGRFCPDGVEADLVGSIVGRGFVKRHWIGNGLHLEIHWAGLGMVTSPVRSVTIERNQPKVIVH